jgi:hypothetical protein
MKYRASTSAGALNGKIAAGDTCIFTFDGTYLRFVSKDTANGLVQSATSSTAGVVKLSTSSTVATDIAGNDDTKAVTPKAINTAVQNSVDNKISVVEISDYPSTPTAGVIYFVYDT